MLHLKLQYFGHLMQRADSLEKTLMLGKIGDRRRRGQQSLRWLDVITNFWSLHKFMSIKSVMPSNHLIPCHTLFLLPSILPSIRVISNESVLSIRWPKHWSFSFSNCPSNEHSGLISLGLTGLISLQSEGLSRAFSNTAVQEHQFFGSQPSLWSSSHIHTWLLEKP